MIFIVTEAIADRYAIEATLGQGGMGRVYRALDTRLNRRVAVKVLIPDAASNPSQFRDATQRMLREARAAAAFSHPNAVAVYDVGEHQGSPFIAMELVSGRSLRTFVGDQSVPVQTKISWLIDVARALAAAHRAGLVHRDIKPDNVMIREDGAVKVLDFGIARLSASSAPGATSAAALGTLTAAGMTIGTPMYMSPEQIGNEPLDGRADQFSWGVMAYELLGGTVPWSAQDAFSLIKAILTTEPPPLHARLQNVPQGVVATIHRAMTKNVGLRFGTMDEVADALLQSVTGVYQIQAPPGSMQAPIAHYGAPPPNAPQHVYSTSQPTAAGAYGHPQSGQPIAPQPGHFTAGAMGPTALYTSQASPSQPGAVIQQMGAPNAPNMPMGQMPPQYQSGQMPMGQTGPQPMGAMVQPGVSAMMPSVPSAQAPMANNPPKEAPSYSTHILVLVVGGGVALFISLMVVVFLMLAMSGSH